MGRKKYKKYAKYRGFLTKKEFDTIISSTRHTPVTREYLEKYFVDGLTPRQIFGSYVTISSAVRLVAAKFDDMVFKRDFKCCSIEYCPMRQQCARYAPDGIHGLEYENGEPKFDCKLFIEKRSTK